MSATSSDPRRPAAPSPSDRAAARAAFLAAHGLAEAPSEPVAGDASTRAYARLRPAGRPTLLLMDAPPAAEGATAAPGASAAERTALGYTAMARLAGARMDAFVATAGWLGAQGFSAPAVAAHDEAAGLALLEDLGDDLFAAVLARGGDEGELYDAAIDTLAALHRVAPPEVLEGAGARWPLLAYDDLALKTAGDLFLDWLPALGHVAPFSPLARAGWEAVWAPVRARAQATAEVVCHRDYHAENLVWLPHRDGAARVGLLDFQDAVRAPRAWDLSMLLHDARRDVSPELRAHALARYLAAEGDRIDPDTLRRDFATFGALNIVRIIGVFHRLAGRDGKARYLQFLPRMWGHLDETLREPELTPLARWLDAHVPPEARG